MEAQSHIAEIAVAVVTVLAAFFGMLQWAVARIKSDHAKRLEDLELSDARQWRRIDQQRDALSDHKLEVNRDFAQRAELIRLHERFDEILKELSKTREQTSNILGRLERAHLGEANV